MSAFDFPSDEEVRMRPLRLLWIFPLVVTLLPAGRALAGAQLSVEEQRAKLIKYRKPYLDFAMPAGRAKRELGKLLKRYTRIGEPGRVEVHGLTLPPLSAEADYCYAATVELDKGARFSELARYGLDRRGGRPSADRRLVALGRTLWVNLGCYQKREEVQVKIAALSRSIANGHDFSDEVGEGTARVQYYRFGNSPFLVPRKDFDKRVHKETRGYRLEKTWRGRLEKPDVLSLRLARGKCYIMVFVLDPKAEVSDEVRRSKNISFDWKAPMMDTSAGGLRGPGGISDFGCAFASERVQFMIGKVQMRQGNSLGKGRYDLKLYARKARRGELARLKREDERARRASRDEDARRKAEHCAMCREKHWGDQAAFEDCAAQLYDRKACY